jgi:hypothetical protein
MNAKENLKIVVNLLTTRNKKNLSKFILKLNKNERNNFIKANNKSSWMKTWLRNKHGFNNTEIQEQVKRRGNINMRNTFTRYVNTLAKFKSNNMKIIKHMTPTTPPPYVKLNLQNKGYLEIEPVCENNHNRGVYIHYGVTHEKYRGQKIGYRLRKVAVNAALNSKIPLYQVAQDVELLVKKGNMPISGKIMKSLGAMQINYNPPCRAKNVRGSFNYSFVVGGPHRVKRPIKKR